jgi:hypothetical protein
VIAGLVAAAALAALAGRFAWRQAHTSIDVSGLADGATVSGRAAGTPPIRIEVRRGGRPVAASVQVDGRELAGEARAGDGAVEWQVPDSLGEGGHELTVSVSRLAGILPDERLTLRFTVDRTPPSLEVTPPAPVPLETPVDLTGRTEPGAAVKVNDATTTVTANVDDAGAFDARLSHPSGPLTVVATDPAGNQTTSSVAVPVRLPRTVGVHVTGAAWSYGPLRQGVLDLIDQGRIDTVELDLKDESGVVNYDSGVPLARQVGAIQAYFDLRQTIADLHQRGVRVVGRIVAFRDPVLAAAAVPSGHPEWVVQRPDGQPLDAYGGFTNAASQEVRDYNVALAVEAADAGIDDILWDYIRRPEGDPASQVFPGLQGSVEQAVIDLLAEAEPQLHQRGTYQGASVFGISASRPQDVAQDIKGMAAHADYLAPMVYPSHWNAGEYGVADPNSQPGPIVAASLADFQRQLAGTGVTLVPWLQDFSLGVHYGAAEVRAQIDAAAGLGIDSFLLWDPEVTYTSDALQPLH